MKLLLFCVLAVIVVMVIVLIKEAIKYVKEE